MSLDDLKLPKGDFFKFTCRDEHDTPNYTFSWELTQVGSSLLQEKKVRFPFMYVFAVEEVPPHKVESHASGCGCSSCAGDVRVVEEQLFCLHEGSGMLQFHRHGTFRIYAMVIWYDSYTLRHSTWRTNRNHVLDNIGRYRSIVIDGGPQHIWSLNQVEEDAVAITSTFFANKPNPTLWWWANLWWENKPRNSCDYRKRLWFVLWLQVPIVSIYALIRGLLMVPSYLGLLLVGFRPSSFSFRPMIHAFSSTFKQICDFESKTSNYAFQDSNGQNRKSLQSALVRLPFFWFAAPILLNYCCRSIYHNPMTWLTAVGILLGFVAAIVGGVFLNSKLQARSKSVEVYYELVPVEKPKKRRVPVRTRWIDAKGKLCLPFPE